MGRLAGKVAVITSGGSGIGLATAKRFVAEGAFVFIVGRRQGELDAAVAEIGRSVVGVWCDVANLVDLDSLFAEKTASAALFLASDDSALVNGSELFVDGGVSQS